jgi:hypothetical protein
LDAATVVAWLTSMGFSIVETMSVAPALGLEPDHLTAIQGDAFSWERLLELEEQLGRRPVRWSSAAAILLCAARSPGVAMGAPPPIVKTK